MDILDEVGKHLPEDLKIKIENLPEDVKQDLRGTVVEEVEEKMIQGPFIDPNTFPQHKTHYPDMVAAEFAKVEDNTIILDSVPNAVSVARQISETNAKSDGAWERVSALVDGLTPDDAVRPEVATAMQTFMAEHFAPEKKKPKPKSKTSKSKKKMVKLSRKKNRK